MLLHRHALLLAFALSPLGCDQVHRETGGVVRSIPSITEGKAAVAQMIAARGRTSGLALMEKILNQPDFSGVLKEWGCIAIFDDTGGLTKALTLKVVDFPSGERYPVREFAGTELDEAREQILAYRKTLGTPPSMAIPIFSHSFRLAVAAAAVNEDSGFVHTLGRGTGDTAEQMQVIKLTDRLATVIAADAFYQVPRQ